RNPPRPAAGFQCGSRRGLPGPAVGRGRAGGHCSGYDRPGPRSGRSVMKDQLDSQMQALGAFIRDRRKSANLTLRQLAERTRLSNPYLSQIERGLHQPSVRVLRLLSDALNVSAETLLTQAGLLQAAAATVPGGP